MILGLHYHRNLRSSPRKRGPSFWPSSRPLGPRFRGDERSKRRFKLNSSRSRLPRPGWLAYWLKMAYNNALDGRRPPRGALGTIFRVLGRVYDEYQSSPRSSSFGTARLRDRGLRRNGGGVS